MLLPLQRKSTHDPIELAPPEPITAVDLPGLDAVTPDAAAAMLDLYLSARRARPDVDRMAAWDEVRAAHEEGDR